MRIPNPSLYQPGGGYHFIDRSTGADVRIDGNDYDDVAAKVLKFRLANGKAPGDPRSELIEYVCNNWPNTCMETSPAEVLPSRNHASLAQKVSAWFAAFYRQAPDAGVSYGESVRRADICTSCPYNRPITGCGSCVENINRLFFIWRRDRPVPQETALGGCSAIGQHNGVGVLAGSLPLLPEGTVLPPRCWRR
jgi:hypothetical protein